MFSQSSIQKGVLVFIASVLAPMAMAQTQKPATKELEKIEVTGTRIKRVNAEAVAPVEVITREQIQRSGQPTVADLIRSIPANNGGSFGESFSNSFAPGASGVSLRGLGQGTTLVLLNGRRISGYGFAQNLSDTFVDLNAIPSSAVERVEVLKDGASALYGSDAIAGVVNIILRRQFQGAEASLSGSEYHSKTDYGFNVSYGLGDLGMDRFNVFGVLDYYKRDMLMGTDLRDTRDMRKEQGGRNYTSLTGGGTWRRFNGNTATNEYKAISECAALGGQVMTGPEAVAAGLINLSTNLSAATLAANRAMAAATNTFCSKNFDDQFTALPETERVGFLGRATYEFSEDVSAFAEVGLSHNTTFQKFQSPFFAGTTGLQKTPGGLKPFPYNITFATGASGNPFATNARYTGVMLDLGTRDSDITSDTIRGLAGLRYKLDGWDMETGLGASQNKVSQMNINRITLSGTSAAFGVPANPQPPIPVSTGTGGYNLDRPSSSTAASRTGMLIDFPRQSTSDLVFVDTRASKEFPSLMLPGGAIAAAVGVEHRRESIKDRPDAAAANGNIMGQGITRTDGSRSNTALFGELSLPILKNLEAQVAVRSDNYSDYGNSTVPKVGMKFTPNDKIAIRANWGKGFRAPTLPQISPSEATFFTSVTDPQDNAGRNISGVYAGNPNLKAENSTSANIGLIIEPVPNFSVAIDAYEVVWQNVVDSPSLQSIVNDACSPAKKAANGGICPDDPRIIRDTSTTLPGGGNPIVTVFSNYQNLAERKTRGFDVEGRLRIPTADMGRFGLRGTVTYVDSFKEDGVEYAGTNGGNNTIPRSKVSVTGDWDYGRFATSLTMRFTPGWYNAYVGALQVPGSDPQFQNGLYPVKTANQTTFDLFARYAFSKNLSVSGSILNLADRRAPYDPGFSTTYFYDFSQFDVRGRVFRLNLNYKM